MSYCCYVWLYVCLHDWWKQHSNNIQSCTTKTSSCFSGMDSSTRSPSSPQPILIELGLTTLHIHEWTSTVNGFFPPTVWIWGYHHKHELAIMNSTPFLKSIALFYFFSIGQQIISKIIRQTHQVTSWDRCSWDHHSGASLLSLGFVTSPGWASGLTESVANLHSLAHTSLMHTLKYPTVSEALGCF